MQWITFDDLVVWQIVSSQSYRQRYKVKNIEWDKVTLLLPFTDKYKKRYVIRSRHEIDENFFKIVS
jgi:hypothetical protein